MPCLELKLLLIEVLLWFASTRVALDTVDWIGLAVSQNSQIILLFVFF